ncbi:hypothetical protein IGK98_002641 [Enterococcus sp. AZ134]
MDTVRIILSFIGFFSSILLLFTFKESWKDLTTMQKINIIVLVCCICLPFTIEFFPKF